VFRGTASDLLILLIRGGGTQCGSMTGMYPNSSMSSWIAAAVLVAGSACGGGRTTEPRTIGPTIGSTHTSPDGTIPDTRPEPSAEAPASVKKFGEDVALLTSDGREDHANVAAALRSLADAIQVVGRRDSHAYARMQHQIEQLETSPPSSLVHANYVRAALDEVVMMAASGSPRMRADLAKYTRELATFAAAVRQLDPDQALLAQQVLVIRALERAVNLLYVAVGARPPASLSAPPGGA
jgi:hypothetical protein